MNNDNLNLNHNSEFINHNLESQMELQKLKKELMKSFDQYKKTMKYLSADLPIECLCLPSQVENILIEQGYLRIYDLFDVDFAKIKGLGVVRIRDLTTRLNQFLSVL